VELSSSLWFVASQDVQVWLSEHYKQSNGHGEQVLESSLKV